MTPAAPTSAAANSAASATATSVVTPAAANLAMPAAPTSATANSAAPATATFAPANSAAPATATSALPPTAANLATPAVTTSAAAKYATPATEPSAAAADCSHDGWRVICDLQEILPDTGVCASIDDSQVAVFRVDDMVYAIDNFDPASGANVLSRGIVGDVGGELVVASPIYKQHFSLATGRCLEEPGYSVKAYPARLVGGTVWVQGPRRAAAAQARSGGSWCSATAWPAYAPSRNC